MNSLTENVSDHDVRRSLFRERSPEEIEDSIRNRRASSPYHRQYYLDFNPATWKLANRSLEFISLSVEKPEEASQVLIQSAKPTKNFRSNKLLDFLQKRLHSLNLDTQTMISVFEIISNTADELSTKTGPRLPIQFDILLQCEELSHKIIKSLDPQTQLNMIVKAVKQGKAFSWLIFFVRGILMEHGRITDGHRFRCLWLKDDNLDEIAIAALERINSNQTQILDSSNPRFILYFWHEYGNIEEKKKLDSWVENQIQSDEGLIKFVSVFSFIGIGKGGYRWTIEAEKLEKFLDLESIKAGLGAIIDRNNDLKLQAKKLLNRIR